MGVTSLPEKQRRSDSVRLHQSAADARIPPFFDACEFGVDRDRRV